MVADPLGNASPVPGGRPAAPAVADLTAPSLARRMACWTYEGILLFAVVFVAGWLFITLGQMREAMDTRRPLLQAFLFVIFGIYFTWFWARGQTLAMKTWNIRVVDRAGRALTQRRALLRYFCSSLWFLPPPAVLAPLAMRRPAMAVLLLRLVALWAALSRFHAQR